MHFAFFGWLKELANFHKTKVTEVEYTKLKISKNLLILLLAEFSKFIQTILVIYLQEGKSPF